MGWKSTTTISRAEAFALIMQRAYNATDSELGDMLSELGYGDNSDLPYYGYNFIIGEKEIEEE